MRAVVLTRHGGPEVLRITDVATPLPRPDEVRVRIRIIGINFAEVLSRRGLYRWAPPLPYILGMEAFGEIDMVGEAVTGRRPGDRVVVGTQFGAYAEFICVPADRALPIPRAFSPEQAAAFAVNYLTAWIGLMEMARLRASDTVLVTSAAGGVGSAAVQIASRAGASVIGAAGRGKQDAVRALGADHALDYDQPGWDSQLAALTGGCGIDVIFELAGGAIYQVALRHVRPMGRVVIAGASGAFPRSRNPFALLGALRNMPRVRISDMLRRSYGVMSFHVGWLLDARVVEPQWRGLVRFSEENGIAPVVGQQYAFDEIADAHRALERRTNIGKVIVHVGA